MQYIIIFKQLKTPKCQSLNKYFSLNVVLFSIIIKYKYFMKKISIVSIAAAFIIFCMLLGGCSTPIQESFCEVSFFVTDQNGLPVQDVSVTFNEYDLNITTLADGHTPTLSVPTKAPWKADEDWFGVMVTLKADGYVPIVIFNFVLQYGQSRNAEIMLLTDDGTLPYCAYVEIPSSDAIRRILL